MIPILLTDTVVPTLQRAVPLALLWGLEGLEVRTVGAGERVPGVNEASLRRISREDDMPVLSVAPATFTCTTTDRAAWLNDVVSFGEVISFCRRVGCPRIVVSGFASVSDEGVVVDAFRRIAEPSRKAGVTVAVLNEVDMEHATGRALADMLAAVDRPSIRAAWDPAAALEAGEDPAEGLRALAGRVALVRCYDVHRADTHWLAVPLGEGAVDWKAQMRILREQAFDGPLSLEVRCEPRTQQGLRDATRLIQLMRARPG